MNIKKMFGAVCSIVLVIFSLPSLSSKASSDNLPRKMAMSNEYCEFTSICIEIGNNYQRDLHKEISKHIKLKDGCTFEIANEDQYYSRWFLPTSQDEEIFLEIFEGSQSVEFTSIFLRIIDYNSPYFNGKFSYITTPNQYISISEITDNLVCYDAEIGYIEKEDWEISNNTYEANYNIPGEYYISIEASDGYNYESVDIEITVIDNLSPMIENSNGYTIIDFNNLISLDTIKSWFIAYDETDGNITHKLTFDTNYPDDISLVTVGTYDLTLSVTDNAGNPASAKVVIFVINNTPPTLNDNEIVIENSNMLTINEIMELIECFDNTGALIPSTNYELISTSYDQDKSVGSYYIEFKVTDSQKNEIVFEKHFKVADKIEPTLEISEIVIPSSKLYDENDIRYFIKSIDDIDGDITSKVELNLDNYKINYNTCGEYICYAESSDKAFNITKKEFIIKVVDSDLPIIYVNDIIKISTDTQISELKLIELLRNISGLYYSLNSISTLETNYFTNANTPGKYEVKMITVDNETEEDVRIFSTLIEVFEKEKEDEKIVKKPKVKWYKRFFRWIKKMIKKIFNIIIIT